MPQSQEFIVLDATAVVLVGIALLARTSQVSEDKQPIHRLASRALFLSRFAILLLGFTNLGTIPLLLVPNLLLLAPVFYGFKIWVDIQVAEASTPT